MTRCAPLDLPADLVALLREGWTSLELDAFFFGLPAGPVGFIVGDAVCCWATPSEAMQLCAPLGLPLIDLSVPPGLVPVVLLPRTDRAVLTWASVPATI